MLTRADIVAEARAWIGTPWQHQQQTKGVACDCAGLIRGIMIELGLADPDCEKWEGANKFLGYPSWPDGKMLQAACDTYMTRIERAQMQPGDAIVLITDYHPQHMGILGDYRHGGFSIIHSSTAARPRRVIETRLLFNHGNRFAAAYSLLG